MAFVEKVEFEGFWGDRDFSINFDQQINFLIGVNGSGKTTVINTIAAALNADFLTLDRLPFSQITIHLIDKVTRRKPLIRVSKVEKGRTPFPSIKYFIKEKSSGKGDEFDLEEIEEARYFRHHPSERNFLKKSMPSRRDLNSLLSRIAPNSWLSIHRASPTHFSHEEKTHDSTIDIKLSQISDNLVRYFAELDKLSSDEDLKFQKYLFLSLLHEPGEITFFSSIKKMDLEAEQESLHEIFENLAVPESEFLNPIKKHFDALRQGLRTDAEKQGFKLNELFPMLNMWRIHSVVQQWEKTRARRADIYKPKDTFMTIINEVFLRKQMKINESNEIFATSQSGKKLSIWDLSSGEKQMFIMLGEALLQRGMPRIYIADEPELSLHVKWQETLVSNLRRINNNIQIIFATHSPDVLGRYEKMVKDMEEILQ